MATKYEGVEAWEGRGQKFRFYKALAGRHYIALRSVGYMIFGGRLYGWSETMNGKD